MRILFTGDSVTDASRKYDDLYDLGCGYPFYTAELLKAKFPDDNLEFINRGVSGRRTKDLIANVEEDVVAFDPDIITVLIGVNDTWRRYDSNDPTSVEDFTKNYADYLKVCKTKTHTKIIIIDAFLIYGMGRDNYREDLDPKLDATRMLAMKYADHYLPLDGLLAAESLFTAPEEISADGVHPAEAGRRIIAGYLEPMISDLILKIKKGE